MSTTQGQQSTESTPKPPFNQITRPMSPFQQTIVQGKPSRSYENINLAERGTGDLNPEVMSPGLPSRSLLPGFSSRQFSQLPTPQSPKDFEQHVLGVPHTPDSPIPHSSQNSYGLLAPASVGERLTAQRQAREGAHIAVHSKSQQTITPESSPFPRSTPRYPNTATPEYYKTSTPRANDLDSSVKLESSNSAPVYVPGPPVSSLVSPPSDQHTSRLSSPFMAKLSIGDRSVKSNTPGRSRPQSHTPESHPIQLSDVFSSASKNFGGSHHPSDLSTVSISTPPVSPLSQTIGFAPGHAAGGEMERIRQAMIQDRLAHFQETENRRPEYLKRTKRTLSEADPSSVLVDDERVREQERSVAVGIMESPNKGRRLKLFQETSEESFEESLMAGGYGRYRTADWVRQPQPLMLATPSPAGPSNVVSVLEEAEEALPTEKELKKRKRLAAFRSDRNPYDGPVMKLFPVELEGRGRVLLDAPAGEQNTSIDPEPARGKKKGGARRKKKAEPTAKEKKALATAALAEDLIDKPNWPDSEFPWKLRTEERAGLAKAEEEEKLRWIERFLDRDSDDEDDEEAGAGVGSRRDDDHEMFLPTNLGHEGDAYQSLLPKGGRGKMVPLPVNPAVVRAHLRRKNAFFPSDPADALAALLSKKSVRALSYRRQRREREAQDDSDDEVVCICNGRDDGRELVQCDGCETWYHLQCIGIHNIAELGKEEDPWFCRECEVIAPSPLLEVTSKEPIFVPTDDEPRRSHSYDPPFFQPPLQDSPMTWNPPWMPQTPTRGGRASDLDQGFSSGSSWVESRHGPSTPQHFSQSVRVHTDNTPSPFGGYNYDESSFDPTSTPSRGIRFNAPFTTPKNNVWSMRSNGLFQTPKASGRNSLSKTFGGPGTLSSALDDSSGSSLLNRMPPYDESPIRRSKSSEDPRERHTINTPLASRPIGSLMPYLLEESPVMRHQTKEKPHIVGRAPFDDGR